MQRGQRDQRSTVRPNPEQWRMIGRVRRTGLKVLGLALGASLAALSPAMAEVVVLQSSAPGLSAGQVLQDGDRVSIPAGNSAILVLPNGSTKTVTGPADTTAGRLAGGVSRNEALLEAVKSFVRTGGTGAGSVGAMRSVAPQSARAVGGPAFSWDRIPISANGDYCVAKSDNLSLVRETARGNLSITVVGFQSGERVTVDFVDGRADAPWPSNLEADVGKYAFVGQGRPMRQIRLRIIDPLPSRDDTLRVLFTQRCEGQVEDFLKTLRAEG